MSDEETLGKEELLAELFAAMQQERRRRRRRVAVGAVVTFAVFGVLGSLVGSGSGDEATASGLSSEATCEDFTRSDFTAQLRFLTDEADRRGSEKNPTDLQGTVSYICANGLDRKLAEVASVAFGGAAGAASSTEATDPIDDDDPGENGNIMAGGDFCQYIPVADVESVRGKAVEAVSSFPNQLEERTASFFPGYTSGSCTYGAADRSGGVVAIYITNSDVQAGFAKSYTAAQDFGSVDDFIGNEAQEAYIVQSPVGRTIGMWGDDATFVYVFCVEAISQEGCEDLARTAFANVRRPASDR